MGDGREALELARDLKPDLIVLDLMLPGLDGFEITRILRKEMTTSILMLTARDDEIDRVGGFREMLLRFRRIDLGVDGRRGRTVGERARECAADSRGNYVCLAVRREAGLEF